MTVGSLYNYKNNCIRFYFLFIDNIYLYIYIYTILLTKKQQYKS